MALFREHRRDLEESMATTVTVANREDLVAYIRKLLAIFDCTFRFDDIEVKPYPDISHCYDPRTGWNTYIVTMPEYGVLGWTDGPL